MCPEGLHQVQLVTASWVAEEVTEQRRLRPSPSPCPGRRAAPTACEERAQGHQSHGLGLKVTSLQQSLSEEELGRRHVVVSQRVAVSFQDAQWL